VYGLKCDGALTGFTYGNGSGLKAEYFTNSTSSSGFDAAPAVTRLDEQINFNWGSGSPAAAVSNDIFKARWTGKIKPLTDDTYSFYITASDGIRLWVNDQLLIDNWTDKTVTVNSATISLQKAKQYNIKLEYYSNTNSAHCILQWSASGICKQNIPSSQLSASTASCSSNGDGLVAEYFSNASPYGGFPTTASATLTVPDVNFDWAGGSPDGISNDNFKARFSGYVQSLDAGAYTFYLTGDDGIRLWIDNKLVIDKWIDQGATEYSYTINLEACHKYAVKVEYYENGGNAVCKLEWSGPTVARQAVPAVQLFTKPDFITTQEFIVFPNPAKDNISVSSGTGFATGEIIAMYNTLGQKVFEKEITGAGEGSIITIPVNRLAAGVYAVRLFRNGKKLIKKVIVTR
jgi:PA14 domain/Secretion system C-terminal sorting domain